MKKIFSLLKTGQGYFLIVQRSTRSLSFMLCKRWLSYNTTVSRSRGSMDSTAVITACVEMVPLSPCRVQRLFGSLPSHVGSWNLSAPLVSSAPVIPRDPLAQLSSPTHSPYTLTASSSLFRICWQWGEGHATPKYVTSDSWVLERWLGG